VSVEPDALQSCAGVSADELSQILRLVNASDIAELDVTLGSTRLSLRRPTSPRASSTSSATSPVLADLAIASPLVGIFHPCVEAGSVVQAGQSIGAIEALGMPTSVEAPQSGTVQELLVFDGSPVEYGQALVILRRDG
jgi:acetyl-CoA carboxylase biotin carboxyl carrier protein